MKLVSRCPWDEQPVTNPGDTCDYDCYALWWAWAIGSEAADLMIENNEGKLIRLTGAETAPNALDEQPWYYDTVKAV
jgi:hypothetical protein